MRTARGLSFSFVTAAALAAAISGSGTACGGNVNLGGVPPDAGDDDPFAGEVDPELVPASKVDILFAIDNSASMGEKQDLLSRSIEKLLRRFVAPSCVDEQSGAVLGSSVGAVCAKGVLEHAPIRDIHVGVVSSSIGNEGTGARDPTDYVCPPSGDRMNDRAHLLKVNRAGEIVGDDARGFLAYSLAGGPNTITDYPTFEADAIELLRRVGQTGCGVEAQLESMYRFLNQPDPSWEVTLDDENRAVYSKDMDWILLGQRAAFLRPDSALVIVMLTDEDDSMVDPRSLEGQGWAFAARKFPGSKVFRQESASGTTAPRATNICATDPASLDCTSCGFQSLCDPVDVACAKIRNDPNCLVSPVSSGQGDGFNGYYGPLDDSLNPRFHRMRQRYGVDPQYPIERYVSGLTNRKVPSRATEHKPYIVDPKLYDPSHARYTHAATCTNPIFASRLPSRSGDELCDLPASTRSRRLVSFTLIGGVSPELLTSAQPTAAEWTKILGAHPEAYDYEGIDPHMIPSVEPRPGLAASSLVRGENGSDPVHGREWDTRKDDLQYACTFPISPTRLCEGASATSCDCDNEAKNPPLCSAVNPKEQLRGKAYPSPRPLQVARDLGGRALVGSICAKDASRAYEGTLGAVATHVGRLLVR